VVFSSVIFIFYFLPVFLLGYYVSGWRAGALLVGSAAFYVWGEGAYVFLLLGLIGLNFAGSLWLDRTPAGGGRIGILAALVVADFSVLGFFKYAEFIAHNLNAILPNRPIPETHHALPLGISFFTFQLVSYVIDVHRGAVKFDR
jgi:alginate O-acetyltransferase complex protein AlgI